MSANQPPVPEGTILRHLRLQQGLRVNELARRANVSSATITLLEQGARRASPALLSRLSAALHVEASLLSGIAAGSPEAPPGAAEQRHERQPAASSGTGSSHSPGGSAWQPRHSPQQHSRSGYGPQRYGPPSLGDVVDEMAQLIATESNPKRAEHRAIMRVLRRLCAYFDAPHVPTIAHIARCWPRLAEDGDIITRLQITQTFGRDAPMHYAIGFRLGANSLCGRALEAHMTVGKRGLDAEPVDAEQAEASGILQSARALDQQMPFINFGSQRSGLATPIIKFGSRVAGVLVVTSPEVDYFRHDDTQTLTAFARLLTLCMQDFYDWNLVHLAGDVSLHEPDVSPPSLRHEW
ncbi:MAG TPA: helix-turn-helix transcriptional regulator [Ktedonobacterales bacterium]|nr:helix-turn-helix transcriptional regulator [Ktedonobacterales bacterium]